MTGLLGVFTGSIEVFPDRGVADNVFDDVDAFRAWELEACDRRTGRGIDDGRSAMESTLDLGRVLFNLALAGVSETVRLRGSN